MALSLDPAVIPTAPEVPAQPPPVFQACPTAPPLLPSPQLLIASAMGVTSLPPAQTPFTAQHYTLLFGG